MKKTVFILAVLLLPILFFGQINNHFEHSDTKWYAARTYPAGNSQNLSLSATATRVYGFKGDTLINNVQWFKMYSTSDSTFQTNFYFHNLIRAENKRVFLYNYSTQLADTLYDFNLNIGDSTKYYFPYDDMGTGERPPTYMKIIAIDSVKLLDGKFYKRFKFMEYGSVREVWFEGIGSIHGVLYPHSAIGFITSGPPSDSLRLSCSFSNNQYVWHHSGYARCYTIISGLKNQTIINDLKIFPNPAHTSINIQLNDNMFGKTNMVITNIAGQVVKSVSENTQSSFEIPIEDLKNGMYFITLSNNGKRFTKKLMVQH